MNVASQVNMEQIDYEIQVIILFVRVLLSITTKSGIKLLCRIEW